MRNFVQEISIYSKSIKPDFIIIPQNGVELITTNEGEEGSLNSEYIKTIDGIGQEDLYYGYNNDDQATPTATTNYIKSFLDKAKTNQVNILVTDYCSTNTYVDDSYNKNIQNNFISFAADHRELDNIPEYPNPILNGNANNITNLGNIKNFLYLINPSKFSSKQSFSDAISTTNFDLIIMDFFFNDEEFTESELNELRSKANGGKRLLISYLSIGEAEEYRYYWQSDWETHPPAWLRDENPDWDGNYKVKYWDQNWKEIIYRNTDSYLDKIIDKGFDGAYLDIVDAFEYFENQ
jgi:cysteinyl-tRNA synthetase, unknown class